jgi:hypothetical protein
VNKNKWVDVDYKNMNLGYDPAQIIDWTTSDGSDLLVLVNQLALPHLQDVIKGAGLDPFTVANVASGSTDIGIGEAEYGLENLSGTGINSVQPFNNITATGQYTLTTGTSFGQIVATVHAYAKVVGATKSVCIPIIGCHDVPLPPLFGQTISTSATVTATLSAVSFRADALMQLDASKLVLTDPNSIKEAAVAVKVNSDSVHIGQVSIDVHGFDDPIIGQTVTNLIVGLLQSKIQDALSGAVEGPIRDNLNAAITSWLGRPGF